MTVTMKTADAALKTAYLDVVSEYLDFKANPFLSKIKKTTDNVWGKEIRKLVHYGINGGVGVGSEDGELPTAYGNKYVEFKIGLKNLYGTIEITDKAIRASENKSGAFTNLLTDEINSLMNAANFNFSRMLMGNGTGKIGAILSTGGSSFYTDMPNAFHVGMNIKFFPASGEEVDGKVYKVLSGNRETKYVTVNANLDSFMYGNGGYAGFANAPGNEITGIMALFDNNVNKVYGVSKRSYADLFPVVKQTNGSITEALIQSQIDAIEESYGGQVNFILCSSGVKRALMNHLSTYKRNLETMELNGGYKTMSFNGIPVVSDRFCPEGTMLLLNTDDFAMHQLCDWQWLEGEDGRILRQLENKPVYRATLVKYAELLCSRPWAQRAITGINEA
ncbi:MAG: phage major capsid protein [Clostridia bacterium]|nr:phage major capsid protein [Clostridia bacterium]